MSSMAVSTKDRVPGATLSVCVTLLQLVTASCVLTLLLSGSLPHHAAWLVADTAMPRLSVDWRHVQTPSYARLPTPGDPLKVLVVYGTRPEAVKMAPLIKELRARKDEFSSVVCVTGQHREMLDQINAYFHIKPDIDLAVMTPEQSLAELSSAMLTRLASVMREQKPDVVVVQGDTSTAFVAALAAFYERIPIAHMEAGLRTYSLSSPFPEEANRKIVGSLASYNFAATRRARDALLYENVAPSSIRITGNTVIDAALWTAKQPPKESTKALLHSIGMTGDNSKRFILLTAHRRENLGEPLKAICRAVLDIVQHTPDVMVVFPLHPNPKIRTVVEPLLGGHPQISLLPPVGYDDMVHLMRHSYFIMTDSGGIQEEATAFGKPILVLRDTTEREEGVEVGASVLVGVKQEDITSIARDLLELPRLYQQMAASSAVYGDGHAAQRMADTLAGIPIEEFDS